MTVNNETHPVVPLNPDSLARDIKRWASAAGFQFCGITDTDLGEHETHLLNWLNDGFHGEMHYMERHGTKRSRPAKLEPGTIRIISVRMNYWPEHAQAAKTVLENPSIGYISRYALGRDYHKLMRKKLQQLAVRIQTQVGDFGFRAFVDSAPVLEKAIAEHAGSGWIGKHSNLLTREGSWFFLGEIFTNLALPLDTPTTAGHCGECTRCITECPTNAIVAPYRVDARRCISYLTIENRGSIPKAFRPQIGNRIYGCDDCQLVCPWNRFTDTTDQPDFEARHNLDATALATLFQWTEAQFLSRMEGSPIRRIGYECWLRNIAVALGNNPSCTEAHTALLARQHDNSPLVREHVAWALERHKL